MNNKILFLLILISSINTYPNNFLDSITTEIDSLYNVYSIVLNIAYKQRYNTGTFTEEGMLKLKLARRIREQAGEIIKETKELYPDYVYLSPQDRDSIALAKKMEKEVEETIKRLKKIKKAKKFYIDKISITECNSLGGTNVGIKCTLFNKKPIKYMHFTFRAYNRVGDPEKCRIKNEYLVDARIIGPINSDIENGSEYFYEWENVWWNSAIAYARIVSWKIIYMDGTERMVSTSKNVNQKKG